MIKPVVWQVKEGGHIFNIERRPNDVFLVFVGWRWLKIAQEKTFNDAHSAIFKYINEGKK